MSVNRDTKRQDRILVEVICERYHCVMYDYAITTVEFVAEDFEGRVEVRPIVRRGNRESAERYLELCRINGRHLSVPTILIDGRVAFTDVPGPEELRKAIEEGLITAEARSLKARSSCSGDWTVEKELDP